MRRGAINIYGIDGVNNTLSIELNLVNGTVWHTKSEIARLFGVQIQKVSTNLSSLFKGGALQQYRVEHYRNGVHYYNLEAIIALAFKMDGGYCHLFREWFISRIAKSFSKVEHIPIIIDMGGREFINN